MLKKIKIMAFVVFTFLYTKNFYIEYDDFNRQILGSDLYYKLTRNTITLKNAFEQKPELHNENVKQLYIPSPDNIDNKYSEYRGFEYITKYKDATSLMFDSKYVPKNFNQVLKKMPNIKTLIYDDRYYDKQNMQDNYVEHLKDLNIEHLQGNFYGWNFDSVINTYKNLKTADIYNNLYEKLEEDQLNIENNSIEELNYFVNKISWGKLESDLYYYKHRDFLEYQSDENLIKDKYALKLNLDTPKLKNLSINFEYPGFPMDIIFNNSDNLVELDNLTLYRCSRPKLISENKIKVKTITFIQTDFKTISIEESIKCIDFDSIENIYIDNMENIEDLPLNLEYPNDQRYTTSVVDLDMLKKLKNLKTLVINKEMASLLPTLEGVNVIIK